jgi:hypothetical protein
VSGLYVLDFGVLGVGAFEYSESTLGVPARVDGVYGDLVIRVASSSNRGVVDMLSVSIEASNKIDYSIMEVLEKVPSYCNPQLCRNLALFASNSG